MECSASRIASLSSASLASAAAVRTCGPPRLIDALEYVPALVGRDVGIEPHGLDLAHVEIEFLGGDLQ